MNRIIQILVGIRPEFDFSISEDYIADGMLDSFDVMTLVAELDRSYGVSIDGLDIVPENFRNVASIEAVLRKNGATL